MPEVTLLQVLIPILGIVLVVVTLYDLAATVIGTGRGAGPLTGPVARRIWAVLLGIHKRTPHPVMLRRGGPSILVTLFVIWVTLLVLGWSMVFGAQTAVYAFDSDEPLSFVGKLYYAAAIVLGRGSTAGRPADDFWQALEEIAGATGILLLTLSIAYFIPVVQAVVRKREVALYITSLGETPEKILNNAWNGRDLGDLHLHIVALTPMIAGIAQRHLAYPIVHYFHSSELDTAIAPAVVALDEVLTMNARVVDEEHRMPESATLPLRRAITNLLETLDTTFIAAVDDGVELERMERLRESGLPVVDKLPEDPTEEAAARRRLLRGYLEHDGWQTSDVLPPTESETREDETEAA